MEDDGDVFGQARTGLKESGRVEIRNGMERFQKGGKIYYIYIFVEKKKKRSEAEAGKETIKLRNKRQSIPELTRTASSLSLSTSLSLIQNSASSPFIIHHHHHHHPCETLLFFCNYPQKE